MTRAVIQGLVLFLLPFVLFAVYLVVRRRNPLLWSHWSDQSLWLAIAGLGFVVISLLCDRPSGRAADRHLRADPCGKRTGRAGTFRVMETLDRKLWQAFSTVLPCAASGGL